MPLGNVLAGIALTQMFQHLLFPCDKRGTDFSSPGFHFFSYLRLSFVYFLYGSADFKQQISINRAGQNLKCTALKSPAAPINVIVPGYDNDRQTHASQPVPPVASTLFSPGIRISRSRMDGGVRRRDAGKAGRCRKREFSSQRRKTRDSASPVWRGYLQPARYVVPLYLLKLKEEPEAGKEPSSGIITRFQGAIKALY